MEPTLWQATSELPSFTPLDRAFEVDAVVVGAGIAGVTAALLLRRAGKRVVVLEARRVGGGETGHTTAHLTELLDARYHALESGFGREGALRAAESARAAIARVEAFADELGADRCGFARVPAYLVARDEAQRDELESEAESLRRVGADVAWADGIPYPLDALAALRVERQAQIHPLVLLEGLVARLVEAGGRIHEETRALEIVDGAPCRVVTDRGEMRARHVLVTTNHPVSSRLALHTKIAPYRTYAVALGPIDPSRFPPALVFDLEDPYHYVRTQGTRDGTFLVVGGEDHKVGHDDDTRVRFALLEAFARGLAPDVPVRHRWSGQVIEPADGLPFIGRSPGAERVLVATGFSGTGITFGTLSGMILSDAVLGVPNAFADLYDARRVKPLAQARRFVAENADVAARLAKDRIDRGETSSVADVPPGEGRLVRSGGKMLAVSRDPDGTVHARSAVCPHLGCHVQWNRAERSWDCPCHGSRYDAAGAVLNGPTTKPLEPAEIPASLYDDPRT
jgi:glycine/D-amino acid oxidase-like deaminating enzyme/nitrite reductase/ring-hydroxylating ferredoxin subunit